MHGLAAADDPGSLYNTSRLVNADRLWRNGVTGAGVDVALVDEGVTLGGEIDVRGMPWNARRWVADAAALRSWAGGWWNGTEWTASTWTTDGWAAAGWTGRTWTGRTWTATQY